MNRERPKLLDLFCGAGGAAMGYHRAGFEVVGVDHAVQPHYPFIRDERPYTFLQREAVSFLMGLVNDTDCAGGWRLSDFDIIHASPPCQGYTLMRGLGGKAVGLNSPRLIYKLRMLLLSSNLPFVIENVPGAPLQNPVTLCGSMFGLGVRRHRLFETNWPLSCDLRHKHDKWPVPVWGDGRPTRKEARKEHRKSRDATLANARIAMGIDWMDWMELSQAIPSSYTEFIGKQLIRTL